jgi:hypothetical protein
MSKLLARLHKLEQHEMKTHYSPLTGQAFDCWRDELIESGRAKPWDAFETMRVTILAEDTPPESGVILISL